MLEVLEELPEGTIAVAAKGRVTAADYDQTLIPLVDKALKQHHKVRLYYELGPEFSGIDAVAAWKDFRIGVEHLPRWDRMAIVTDVEWIQHTMHIFRFLVPGELRVFPLRDATQARAWIAGSSTR